MAGVGEQHHLAPLRHLHQRQTDLAHGCHHQRHVVDVEQLVPITYMNSSAALKAFVGREGGAVCTSTNARGMV